MLRCSKIKVMSPEGLMTYAANPKEIQILPPPQLMTVPAEVGRRINRCQVLSKSVPGIMTHTNVRHNDFDNVQCGRRQTPCPLGFGILEEAPEGPWTHKHCYNHVFKLSILQALGGIQSVSHKCVVCKSFHLLRQIWQS